MGLDSTITAIQYLDTWRQKLFYTHFCVDAAEEIREELLLATPRRKTNRQIELLHAREAAKYSVKHYVSERWFSEEFLQLVNLCDRVPAEAPNTRPLASYARRARHDLVAGLLPVNKFIYNTAALIKFYHSQQQLADAKAGIDTDEKAVRIGTEIPELSPELVPVILPHLRDDAGNLNAGFIDYVFVASVGSLEAFLTATERVHRAVTQLDRIGISFTRVPATGKLYRQFQEAYGEHYNLATLKALAVAHQPLFANTVATQN